MRYAGESSIEEALGARLAQFLDGGCADRGGALPGGHPCLTRMESVPGGGTFLTLGGVTGLCLQTPAGGVVDATRRKRTLIALALAGIVGASLLLARGRRFGALLGAQLL